MRLFKKIYFNVMTCLVAKFAKMTGGIHGPWTHKFMSQDNVEDILEIIQPGDIILTHTRGELTTATIPGFWKHCEMYIGDNFVVGAVAPQVRKTRLENIIHKTDYVAVARLIDVTPEERIIMVDEVKKFIGVYYDLGMDFNKPDKVCCSELMYNAVNKARTAFLNLRERLGFDTITPQDIYEARTCKFKIIYLEDK